MTLIRSRTSLLTIVNLFCLIVVNPRVNAQLVMDLEIYKKVVEDVHSVFNNTCVIFLYTVEDPMQALGPYEAERLMSLLVYNARLHIRTFAYAIKTFKENIGDSYFTLKRPLFVLINDSEEMRQQFSTIISPWISMAYINWLIFFRDETDVGLFFSQIYVPLDCIFLTLQKITEASDYELNEIYSVANNTDLIKRRFGIWNKNDGLTITRLGLYQRRNDLRGQIIKVASIEDPPLTLLQRSEVDGKVNGITGFYGILVQLLEENMNCTVTYEACDSWGAMESDGTWSGIVGMLVRKEIDLAATSLVMTRSRLDAIQYTTPVFSTKSRIYIKRPYYTAVKWTAYSDPFYPGIWLSILIVVVLSSTITLFGCKILFAQRVLIKTDDTDFTFNATSFHTFGILCGQGHDSVDIDSMRIVNLVVHITGVIILAAYAAALISFLAIKVFVMPFKSMEGLLNDGSYKLTVVNDSADYSFFQTSSDPIVQRMYREILEDVKNLPKNYFEGLSNLCTQDKQAFMTMDNNFAILEHKIPCILEPLDTIMQTTIAMAVPRRSPYRGLINNNILLMMDSGILQRVIATELLLQSTRTKDHWASVEIVDVLPLFLLVLGGTLCGIVLLFFEKIYVTRLKKFLVKRLSIKQINVNFKL